jgi:hypothetical protein
LPPKGKRRFGIVALLDRKKVVSNVEDQRETIRRKGNLKKNESPPPRHVTCKAPRSKKVVVESEKKMKRKNKEADKR